MSSKASRTSGTSTGFSSSSERFGEFDSALALNTTDPGAASRAWIEIEHGLVEDAQLAPVVSWVITHAVSDGTENVQIKPQCGILLSRLWVR